MYQKKVIKLQTVYQIQYLKQILYSLPIQKRITNNTTLIYIPDD